MLGAIAGDIIGSVHEGAGTKTKEFPLFVDESRYTDDSITTVAVADHLLQGTDLIDCLHTFFAEYPGAGYGARYFQWAASRSREPYGSWGNGSAMRVSPVGIVCETLDDVLERAAATAAVSHDHPEGIRGAQATAAAVFLARTGHSKDEIRRYTEERFGYDLSARLDDIRPTYGFDVSCQGSVPQSIVAFLEADDFEDAVRNAISLGGDADTMACIAGAIAEPYFGGVPGPIRERCLGILDERLRGVVLAFVDRFGDRVQRDRPHG